MSYLNLFLESCKGKSIIIFGASTAGKDAPNYLLSKGISVSYYVDNDQSKFDTLLNGYEVKNPTSLLQEDNPTILITSSFVLEIKSQLLSYGIEKVFALPGLGNIGKIHKLYDSSFIKDNRFKIEQLKNIVFDDKSKITVDAIINNRLFGDFKVFENIFENDIFFPSDIFDLAKIRVFVDIGAFYGDTLLTYKNKVKNDFEMIYAFEPDPFSFKELLKYKSNKTTLINKGIFNDNKRLSFTLDDIQTKADLNGKHTIDVIRLDDFDFDYVPEYIKIHVQGLEKEAIEGATETISASNAIVSVVLNQKPCDLWEIPLYIKRVFPSSKIFIRHHSKSIVNTVCYFYL